MIFTNITFYANDSIGNEVSSFLSWTYNLTVTDEYYVSSTVSGATNPFNITLISDSQITVAYLNYNGTDTLGSISSSGNTYILSKNKVAPGVSSEENLTFYWTLTNAVGLDYNTTSHNQTVTPIVINETCGAGMYVNKKFYPLWWENIKKK